MPYIPYAKIILDSTFTMDQAAIAIRNNLYQGNDLFTDRPFRGSFDGDQFECARVTGYWARFEPNIHGRFEVRPNGRVLVHVRMVPNYFAYIPFLGIAILALTGLYTLAIAIRLMIPETAMTAIAFMAIAALLWLGSVIAFNYHYRRCTEWLTYVFNAQLSSRAS